MHQVLQSRKAIQSNLDDVAAVLAREKPDVVALQEADGPSAWSGNFDHVRYLAGKAAFTHSVRGEHAKAMKVSYGTALLSRLPLRDPASIAFKPSPPTPSKGFVVGTVDWPGDAKVEVDVVSVHLDFSRQAVRRKQVEEMVGKLAGRGRPLILMGDFNCEWQSKEPTLRTLAQKLNLRAWRPEAADMDTFRKLRKRLDWILISPALRFSRYDVLADGISDHLGIVCELGMAGGGG